MPYTGAEDPDLPSNVTKLPARRRAQWVAIWNSAYKKAIEDGEDTASAEALAFQTANGVLKDRRLTEAEDVPESSGMSDAFQFRMSRAAAAFACIDALYADPELRDRVSYLRDQLSDLVSRLQRDEDVLRIVYGKGETPSELQECFSRILVEAGARLSIASRSAIEDAIKVLQDLLAEYRRQIDEDRLAEAVVTLVSLGEIFSEAAKKQKDDSGDEDSSDDDNSSEDSDSGDTDDSDADTNDDSAADSDATQQVKQIDPGLQDRTARSDDQVSARVAWAAYYALRDAIGDEIADRVLLRRQQELRRIKGLPDSYRKGDKESDPALRESVLELVPMTDTINHLFVEWTTLHAEDASRDGTEGSLISTAVLAEAAEPTDANTGTSRFMMAIIEAGLSLNNRLYEPHVLRDAVPLLEGKPMYMDHPNDPARPMRSLRDKVGWWDKVQFVENYTTPKGQAFTGLIGRLNLFAKENSPAPWFEGMIRQALAEGRPDLVGVSIYAGGPAEQLEYNGRRIVRAKQITVFSSADAVAEPGANGQALFAASKNHPETEGNSMDPDPLTVDRLRAEHPELVAALLAESRNSDTTPPQPSVTVDEFTQLRESMQADRLELQRERTQLALQRRLGQSKLSDAHKEMIVAEVGDGVFTESQLSDIFAKYDKIVAAVPQPQPRLISANAHFPVSMVESQTALETAMLALDDFFGVTIPEDKRGKFPKIHSFKEAYISFTGDREIRGIYAPDGVLAEYWGQPMANFIEALPGATHVIGGGTITMSGMFGVSMNKKLQQAYRGQPQWWRPVVDIQPISDFKTQTRLHAHNFGSLTERTTDGAEYTELDWGETSETYTATGFGNVVTVGRRAIINDDLGAIRRIPQSLGVSAAITLNEYVANIFLANSGNGPTMADSVQWFNAASHQSNRGTSPLSYDAVVSARTTIANMKNHANKRIGLSAAYLLVPNELEAAAWQLVSAPMVPNTANNTPNILSNGERGLSGVIRVPQFTDATNWYMMCSPEENPCLELGFLFGREEPEFFQQNDPGVGMPFSNDVMAYKVRHEYGGGVVDYRGAFASIVAD